MLYPLKHKTYYAKTIIRYKLFIVQAICLAEINFFSKKLDVATRIVCAARFQNRFIVFLNSASKYQETLKVRN